MKPAYPNGVSYTDAMRRFPGPPSGWMIPKSVLEQVGGFDVGLKSAEDHDLCLRILAKYKCVCDPSVQVLYRVVRGSLSRDHVRNYDQVRRVIRKNRHFAPIGPLSYWWNARVMMLTTTAGAFTSLLRKSGVKPLLIYMRRRPGSIPYFVVWSGRAVMNRVLYMFNAGPLRSKERASKEISH